MTQTISRPEPGMPKLDSITNEGRALPSRLLVYAREGWGKTSLAAQFPA